MMLIVGLTGGIGSGKSTVATLFAKKGVPVLDADYIAREVTEKGRPALASMVSHFGNHILLPDGSLNREEMRRVIFDHPEERLWLEKLLHPLIRQTIHERIQAIEAPYCIIVIPLLFETEPLPFINRILVIDTPESLQISRAHQRDRTEPSDIAAIIATQVPRAHRIKHADDIIINDRELDHLIPQVEKLHQQYQRLGQS